MTKLQQFFYDNACYHDPATETQEHKQNRAANAAELATAVHYAADQGWSYEWADDTDEACNCEEPNCGHSVEYCLLQAEDRMEVLGSLSGICGATREYRRVVEAELALEAMHAHVAATAPAEPQEAAVAPVTVSDLIDYLLANVENPGATRVFLTEREAAQVETDEFITLESVYRQFQEGK